MLTGCEIETVVSTGTGIQETQHLHKTRIIKQAIKNRQPVKGWKHAICSI
ncbi:nicotinate-nucleotide--dimethylbenzimidazole phosphoribosyltransferase [Peribacillus deserti]